MSRFLVPLLMVVALWGTPAAAQQDQQAARAFISTLGDQTISLLTAPGATQESLEVDFRQLFRESFDTDTIGRFVLGRYWTQASAQQQQEYLSLFREFVVRTYAQRFSEYSGEQLLVQGTQPAGSSDVMVSTVITAPDGRPPVAVDWRTRNRSGQVKIIDVMIENVSMAITYRNEFASVIQQNGGSIDGLLQTLRNRVQG